MVFLGRNGPKYKFRVLSIYQMLWGIPRQVQMRRQPTRQWLQASLPSFYQICWGKGCDSVTSGDHTELNRRRVSAAPLIFNCSWNSTDDEARFHIGVVLGLEVRQCKNWIWASPCVSVSLRIKHRCVTLACIFIVYFTISIVHYLIQKQKLTHSLRYLFAFFDMNVYHILICWRLLTLQFTTYHLLTYGVMPLGF